MSGNDIKKSCFDDNPDLQEHLLSHVRVYGTYKGCGIKADSTCHRFIRKEKRLSTEHGSPTSFLARYWRALEDYRAEHPYQIQERKLKAQWWVDEELEHGCINTEQRWDEKKEKWINYRRFVTNPREKVIDRGDPIELTEPIIFKAFTLFIHVLEAKGKEDIARELAAIRFEALDLALGDGTKRKTYPQEE